MVSTLCEVLLPPRELFGTLGDRTAVTRFQLSDWQWRALSDTLDWWAESRLYHHLYTLE